MARRVVPIIVFNEFKIEDNNEATQPSKDNRLERLFEIASEACAKRFGDQIGQLLSDIVRLVFLLVLCYFLSQCTISKRYRHPYDQFKNPVQSHRVFLFLACPYLLSQLWWLHRLAAVLASRRIEQRL